MARQTKKRIGQLIVIDGIDQSGKKTQARLLARRIREQGFACVIWDFPVYHTRLGRRLNAYLTGKEKPDLHVVHLLYAANKWEVAPKIIKQRARGIVVIANRYTPSNLAYGVAHGLPLAWLRTLETGLPKPNQIFILDIPVRLSFNRKRKQRDIHEEDATYLKTVRRIYLRLAKQHNWVVVNSESSPSLVHSEIWRAIKKSFTESRLM